MVEVVCEFCGSTVQIPITENEYEKIITKKGCIQDIVPDLAPEYREMFISGMCPKCWDEMFNFSEEMFNFPEESDI